MDSISIELKGSEIASIDCRQDGLTIEFSRAYLIKTMTGSKERTRWWQAGSLLIDGAETGGDIPSGPLVCAGGDIEENIYTYRDMIPIPLESRGRIRCELSFGDGESLVVTGTGIRLIMHETPKYIEHLRAEAF
ncbi:hypothetical protein [Imhoffiella purpurea]|uniref:Uncharacterized protein n=1 Tax=Imhoffiella purpurea TaxID=1249627 RepID=W9VLZ4_9GAMM|nr:hypothetical protein [Imhoffiella purpurea]EXJ17127.1 hypothetical protein D779_0879 [Imhoffiella purpurea]